MRKPGKSQAKGLLSVDAAESPELDALWENKRSRDSKRGKKLSAIVARATSLFVLRGYERTSIDDVARELGVTKATIYHYYGTKEDLLMACIMRGVEAFETTLAEALNAKGKGLDRFTEMLRGYGLVAASEEGRLAMTVSGFEILPENQKILRDKKKRCGKLLKQAMSEAIEDGSMRPLNLTVCMYAVTGGLNWLSEWFDPKSELSGQEIVNQTIDIYVHGIAAA